MVFLFPAKYHHKNSIFYCHTSNIYFTLQNPIPKSIHGAYVYNCLKFMKIEFELFICPYTKTNAKFIRGIHMYNNDNNITSKSNIM